MIPGDLGQIPIDIKAEAPVAGDAIRVMLLVKVNNTPVITKIYTPDTARRLL